MSLSAHRLASLRALMRAAAPPLSAYIVPSSDEHLSEYTPNRDRRREWLSNFSGSAGTAVVTHTEARLWTDGRYFLQAEKELDASAGWRLMRDRLPETPSIETWLAGELRAGDAVGADARLFSLDTMRRFSRALAARGISLTSLTPDLVDAAWGAAQPPRSVAPIRLHPHAGEGVREKLARVRHVVSRSGAGALAVTSLDDVAWLLNLRGVDVHACPVFIAYALVESERATLFVDAEKVPAEVSSVLAEAGVGTAPYEDFYRAVGAVAGAGTKVWVDKSSSNAAVWAAAAGPAAAANWTDAPTRVHDAATPIALMKAVKNESERAGMRAAHVRDGAALVRWLGWLHEAHAAGELLTEASIADALDAERARVDGFVSLSFDTIAGWNANGAIIHYRPSPATAASLSGDGVLLIDSGGQYVDGTTDVTRTVWLGAGPPPARVRAAWTAVLAGHISLARARFPSGTGGVALDALARAPIWERGLDYCHGTGHGIGAALNVHEGPHGLSNVPRNSYDGGVVEHMTTTIEPGYYENGAFGIRIENVTLVTRAGETAWRGAPAFSFGPAPWLELEALTLVPIGGPLLDPDALSADDKAWLNAYNARVAQQLAPLLEGDARSLAYLLAHTEAV